MTSDVPASAEAERLGGPLRTIRTPMAQGRCDERVHATVLPSPFRPPEILSVE